MVGLRVVLLIHSRLLYHLQKRTLVPDHIGLTLIFVSQGSFSSTAMHTQMQYPTPLPEGTAMNVEGIYVCAVASSVNYTYLSIYVIPVNYYINQGVVI